MEVGGVEHPGFVNNDGRAGEPPQRVRPVRARPFVKQFGDRVSNCPGLAFEDTGCFGGRGESEHRAVLDIVEVGDRGARRGRDLGVRDWLVGAAVSWTMPPVVINSRRAKPGTRNTPPSRKTGKPSVPPLSR